MGNRNRFVYCVLLTVLFLTACTSEGAVTELSTEATDQQVVSTESINEESNLVATDDEAESPKETQTKIDPSIYKEAGHTTNIFTVDGEKLDHKTTYDADDRIEVMFSVVSDCAYDQKMVLYTMVDGIIQEHVTVKTMSGKDAFMEPELFRPNQQKTFYVTIDDIICKDQEIHPVDFFVLSYPAKNPEPSVFDGDLCSCGGGISRYFRLKNCTIIDEAEQISDLNNHMTVADQPSNSKNSTSVWVTSTYETYDDYKKIVEGTFNCQLSATDKLYVNILSDEDMVGSVLVFVNGELLKFEGKTNNIFDIQKSCINSIEIPGDFSGKDIYVTVMEGDSTKEYHDRCMSSTNFLYRVR